MQYSSKNFLSTIKIFRYFRTVIMQKRSIYLKLNTKILYKKCKLKNSFLTGIEPIGFNIFSIIILEDFFFFFYLQEN